MPGPVKADGTWNWVDPPRPTAAARAMLNSCPRCSGTGQAPAVRGNRFILGETMPCPACNGVGHWTTEAEPFGPRPCLSGDACEHKIFREEEKRIDALHDGAKARTDYPSLVTAVRAYLNERDKAFSAHEITEARVQMVEALEAAERCPETAPNPLQALALVANDAANEALFDDHYTEWRLSRGTLNKLIDALVAAGIRKPAPTGSTDT